jgi:hypothetical protein
MVYRGNLCRQGLKGILGEFVPPGAKGYIGGIGAARGIIARYM